ncbi:hypothetical protein [Ruania rhizosphaerae]|uniref:hypothetical protein n=1 Tax=Ruania rhizosphaerae TaxID=1840413 RepID=UPI00190FB96F|nr:hypothetical protein [Ruania rhizosphaerae]
MTTTPAMIQINQPLTQHEHGWHVESRHTTTMGTVLYVRCGCGARRVDLQGPGEPAPSGISATIES